MTPSEIRDQIREGLRSTLSTHGFRGSSSTFTRKVGDLVQLLQLQGDSGNTVESSRFTVNVAVWCPALASDKTPSVVDAHWLMRLGQLSPGQSDLWWEATDSGTADEAAREIASAIESYAVPALDQLRNATDLLALWRSGSSPGLTRVLADRLRRRLEESLRRGEAK